MQEDVGSGARLRNWGEAAADHTFLHGTTPRHSQGCCRCEVHGPRLQRLQQHLGLRLKVLRCTPQAPDSTEERLLPGQAGPTRASG